MHLRFFAGVSVAATLLAGTSAAFAETARETLVADWLKGATFGLPVQIGSSSYDPATQAVILDAVSIGEPGGKFSLSFNDLTFEDPRRTPTGLFAAHAIRASGISARLHVDPAAFLPETGQDGAAQSLPPATADPGQEADRDDGGEDGDIDFEAEVAVAKPFDTIVSTEAMLIERVELPFSTPPIDGSDVEAAISAWADWILAIRADWIEATGTELRVDGLPGGDQKTTYGLIYAAGIHDGRTERSGADTIDQVAEIEGRAQHTTIGNVYVLGQDVNPILAVIDPRSYADGKGDGRRRPVIDKAGYNDLTVTVPEGKLSIASIELAGATVRQPDKPILPMFLNLISDPKAVENDPEPFMRELLPAALGLYGVDLVEISSLAFEATVGPRVSLGEISLTDMSSDRLGTLALRDISVDGGAAGSGKLDILTLNNVRFGSLMSWISFGKAMEDGREPAPGELFKVIREGMPAVDFVEIAGLSVTQPLGTISLDAYATTNSDFLDQLPRRYDTTFTRLIVPVSAITDPKVREQLTAMGYEQIVLSGAIAAHYDTDTGEFRLLDVTLKSEDMGIASADIHLANIPVSILDDPDTIEMRMREATIVDGSVTFGNQSIVEKIFEVQAKPLNQDPEQFRKNFGAGMPFMLGFIGDPELQKTFAGPLAAFFDDPKSLTISIKPAAPLPLSALDSLDGGAPGEAIRLLGVDIKANE